MMYDSMHGVLPDRDTSRSLCPEIVIWDVVTYMADCLFDCPSIPRSLSPFVLNKTDYIKTDFLLRLWHPWSKHQQVKCPERAGLCSMMTHCDSIHWRGKCCFLKRQKGRKSENQLHIHLWGLKSPPSHTFLFCVLQGCDSIWEDH